MKKIIISSNSAWSIVNFRMNLMHAIRDAGYELIVIAPEDGYSWKIREQGFPYYPIKINPKGTNFFQDAITIFQFYKLYRSIKPDLVLHYTVKPNIYGTLAARILKIPAINNIAGLGSVFLRKGPLQYFVKLLYKFTIPRADHLFFQNKDDYRIFEKAGLVPEKRASILAGSGVDLNRFKPAISKNGRDQANGKKFSFILIARMIWEKGIKEYVDAARILVPKYPEMRFNLIGPVKVKNPSAIPWAIIEKWQDEGIVNYLGVTDQIEAVLETADCVVLPSYYREGVPRSLLESAAMGKPLVTTDSVGCREVVNDGENGYLVQPRDARDLAEKLEKIYLLSARELKKMQKSSRKLVEERFDEKKIIQAYLDEIKKIPV